MAESGFPLPKEAYCPLCEDTLKDPVTIPCGDTFCLECIKIYWEKFDHMGVYRCPECHAVFTPRPVLKHNLPDINHEPRRQLPELTGRKICLQHEKGLELFCRSDQMCICVLCTVREHRDHNISSAEEEHTEKQKILVVTQSEVQRIIQERMKELQELKHNVEVLKSGALRAQAESDKTFHEMLQAVERWKAKINQMIMANMQAAMSQAEGYVDRLEQEILELQRRDAELRQILETEDNIHFLQNFPTLCVPPEVMVPKVLINPQFSFGEMSKTAIQ